MTHQITDSELLAELKKRFEQNKKSLLELKSLNEELVLVNKKLEESEAMKSHFVSNITNEIINPFTSILGLTKAILSVDKENWKKVISMIALIHSEAFSLDFQFRNIFFAAKIEAGEIAPEILSVDVKNIIEGVIESFKFEAKKKKLQVVFDFDLPKQKQELIVFVFKTDPEKLKLIVANLLSNAINYSFDNGKVEIRVWLNDGNLMISVKDNGIGISKENQKIIFDRFNRLDTGISSINRGHGLGLSVNKEIIEMLNGKIDIESELGKGTCFTVTIPENESPTEDFASDANQTFFDNDGDTF